MDPGIVALLLFFVVVFAIVVVGGALLFFTVFKGITAANKHAASLRPFLQSSGAFYLPSVHCMGGGPFAGIRAVELWALQGRLYVGERGHISEYATMPVVAAGQAPRASTITEVSMSNGALEVSFATVRYRGTFAFHGLPAGAPEHIVRLLDPTRR